MAGGRPQVRGAGHRRPEGGHRCEGPGMNIRWKADGLSHGDDSETGRHETTIRRRSARLVLYGDVHPVEPVLQVSALAQDHGSRPFHKLTHFVKRGRGETPVAQVLSQPGGTLVPKRLGTVEISGTHCLSYEIEGKLAHDS